MKSLLTFLILSLFAAYGSYAQTFAGPLTVANGVLNLSAGGPTINSNLASGVDLEVTTPDDLRFNFTNLSTPSLLIQRNGSTFVNFNVGLRSMNLISGNMTLNSPSDPGQFAVFLARPTGTRNNIGHLELGSFGNVSGTSKWIGLGSAPAAVGNVYGKRIQWNDNFAVFNLRQVSATQKDLAIQWGGTTANNRLRFEYATSSASTAATTYMQIESNGNVGIGGLPATAERLYVNGRIGFGSIEFIEDVGSNTVGIGGNLFPASAIRNIGSNAESWNQVFASSYITVLSLAPGAGEGFKQLSGGLERVMKMNPITYEEEGKASGSAHMGFIPEEMLEVMPEVVFNPATQPPLTGEDGEVLERDPDSRMGINYTEMIPVLVKALQEQQTMIDELVKEVADLRSGKGDVTTPLVNPEQTGSVTPGSRLFQNYPNPSVDKTTIRYELPEEVNEAVIAIFDLNGKELRSYNLNKGGVGELELPSNILKPGTYVYKLRVEGVEIDSKRMILLD